MPQWLHGRNGAAAYLQAVRIFIRNMVCNRCIKVVTEVLRNLGIDHDAVLLGEAVLQEPLAPGTKAALQAALQAEGFELIDGRKTRIIERVKRLILERVANAGDLRDNLSDHLAGQLHLDYPYLSSLFSDVEGLTIERYFIAQKIEKAKELLVYDELSLSEIADRLGYSSVQHLSNQFRKVTGLTPTHFKKIGASRRKPLDGVS